MNSELNSIFKVTSSRDLWEKDIKIYPKGLLSRRKPTRLKAPSVQSTRGSIKGFSRHSLLRLREKLLTASLGDCPYTCLGITLTLPWRVSVDSKEVFDQVTSDYKAAFNQFASSFRRRFSGSVAIFRHELQVRRVPHCHIVFYLSDFDFKYVSRGRSATASDFIAIVSSMWLHALDNFQYDFSVTFFHNHGVKVESLNSNLAIFRYLSDHSSKKKKVQLGYRGKQWGILNKKLIVPESASSFSFSDVESKQVFYRHIGRVVRFFIPAACSFGRKLSRPFGNRSVIFVDQSTSLNIFSACMAKRISKGSFSSDGLKGFYPAVPLPF